METMLLKDKSRIDVHFDVCRGVLGSHHDEGTRCFLYSKEGLRYSVSKFVLLQTPHLRTILQSVEAETRNGEIDIYFPEVDCHLLKSVIYFLYHGVLEGSRAEQGFLLNVLVKMLGFPIAMQLCAVDFMSDEYAALTSFNAEFCTVCQREDISFRQVYPHLKMHVERELIKCEDLICEGRPVVCCFCDPAKDINYRGEVDKFNFVKTHYYLHLMDSSKKLEAKYRFKTQDGSVVNFLASKKDSNVKEMDAQDDAVKAVRDKSPVRDDRRKRKRSEEPPQEADEANKSPRNEPEDEYECVSCSDVVADKDLKEHLLSHNFDFWPDNELNVNIAGQFVCSYPLCKFTTERSLSIRVHLAIYHDELSKLCSRRNLNLDACFKQLKKTSSKGDASSVIGRCPESQVGRYYDDISDDSSFEDN